MKSWRLKILILSLCFFTKKAEAQNLVLNPSFEDMLSCPTTFSQLNLVINWNSPTLNSSGYCNSCSNPSFVGVPQNGAGYQLAKTGNAYAGFIALQDGDAYITYVQGEFLDTLKKDSVYCINFWISLTDNSNTAIAKMGAYISDTAIYYPVTTPLNLISQIESPAGQYLNDTVNWMLVSGTYISQGGEKYITIGNFHDISSSDSIYFGSGESALSSYYIDDVSVFQITNADSGADTAICSEDSIQIGSTNYAEFTYNWQPTAGLSNAYSGITKAKPTQTTTYYLTQTTPCSFTTDSVTITVCDLPPSSNITIPNIFTPNNDGINDVFKITTQNITRLNCKIYNRWGILVGELTKINEMWDGNTTSGLPCNAGVYYYVLTAIGEDGKEYDEKGFVSLVR